MYSIKLVRRGINSRRLRKLNSVADLVGQTVAVSEDDTQVTESEVEAVKVNPDESVDITLATGEDMNLDAAEAQELVETGETTADVAEVESIDGANCGKRGRNDEEVEILEETEVAPEEFEVTRDVVDESGDVDAIVTSKVEAADEDDAVAKVQLVDSRRKRNSRAYRVRKVNSEPAGPSEEDIKKRDEILAKPQVNWTADEQKYMSEKWGINCDVKEFKIARNCGKMRKIASVTAPSLEEAIEAVKAKDAEDKVQADGYEELVDKLPQAATVVINSDVEEPIEDDTEKPKEDPKPAEDPAPAEAPKEEPKEDPKPEETEAEKAERESNSYKGVADYVKRAYGIDM